MGNSVKPLKKVIEECSDTNRHEWPDEARTILEAVRRISRPTKGKVRRTIAEAILKKLIVPSLSDCGWKLRGPQAGNPPCDLLLERDSLLARIDFALLQPATTKFKRTYRAHHSEGAHGLEVKKSQLRVKGTKGIEIGGARRSVPADTAHGRSYTFDEFDILAVNIQAATYRWLDFRYTLSGRLRPHPIHPSLINVIQSVPLTPNEEWTDDLSACLEWYSKANSLG